MININTLTCGTITITSGTPGPEPGPTAPNGKVLYKTEAGGDWLQDDADITDGAFNGFANKSNAVEVIIPSKDSSGNTVTSIGESAFWGCNGLTNVTIGNGVTSIGEYAFSRCSSLMSLTIPNSVMSIEYHAFEDCSGLINVTFDGFDKSTIKSKITGDDYLIFGEVFYDPDTDEEIEKTFHINCIDGSFNVTFGTDYSITFTDL